MHSLFSLGYVLATEHFVVACSCSREDMVAERVTAVLHFLQEWAFSFFHVPCVTVDLSVSPSLFPSPILLLTPPPAMEMNSVLWI